MVEALINVKMRGLIDDGLMDGPVGQTEKWANGPNIFISMNPTYSRPK
jgi:hypothetical protein